MGIDADGKITSLLCPVNVSVSSDNNNVSTSPDNNTVSISCGNNNVSGSVGAALVIIGSVDAA